MTAKIQLTRGIDEDVSDVRLTRAKDGSNGTATFIFKDPKCTNEANKALTDITGMFMTDEEGELVTRNVNAKFINGKPAGIEAVYIIDSPQAWDRFMRFMNRYAEANGMGFNKA
ncbi:photosystem II reaction center protein Psb28 [Synechococcus sp. PCC 7502]|uniref:photosystem II reaction center protein Psb28 n=1 Tax=Synechococcus sp. PCC 7502 TaxID=1173263 RepID=UPI00029F83B6|nr:photosystem II reaction center protein Psb28 [Synechococcus sp. PCC 7502]AFY73137.1 photosystem II reaction center protein Psb28 [Synechococcus sp. PCC 7502]